MSEIISHQNEHPILQISSIQDLTQGCDNRSFFDSDSRLTYGIQAQNVPDDRRELIYGYYGLQFVDYKTAKPVAVSGFNLDMQALEMDITHTPQGLAVPNHKWNDNITSRERNRLLRSNFRGILMQNMLRIACMLGIRRVCGMAAVSKTSIEDGLIAYQDLVKRVDAVFEQSGFTYDSAKFCYYRVLNDE